jgi:hypothetical protein
MRWVFLLVGLAAGFALGYAVRDERPLRRARMADIPERAAAEPNRAIEQVVVEPQPGVPDPKAVQPSAEHAVGGGEGRGRVVVTFSGSRRPAAVTLDARDMFGAKEEHWIELDAEGRVQIDVRAGRYLVSWSGDSEEPFGVYVDVVAGRTTYVRGSDGARRPTPLGLGRVLVVVDAIDGGPQPEAAIGIFGNGDLSAQGGSGLTGKSGRCVFEVVPGRYQILLGAVERDVVVVAGKESAVRFRHTEEGDLMVRGAPERTQFHLMREVPPAKEGDENVLFQSDGRFLYVPAGTYRLIAYLHGNGRDRRDLGPVRVDARVCTKVDARLPKGGLRVRIIPPGGKRAGSLWLSLEAGRDTMQPRLLETLAHWTTVNDVEYWHCSFKALTPGPYVVRIADDAWAPVERHVTVEERETEVEIELTPR